MLPIISKLKKERHKIVARAQDIMIEEIYKIFDKAVLHGGTSIWRCYKGNRFSEDIDVYILKDINKINKVFENLEKKGFIIEKKKIGENSLFSKLKFNRETVRLEAIFKTIKGSLKEYENVDGSLIIIYSLTVEELLDEKVETYLKRLKVKDLYDVFFLLRYVKDIENVKKSLNYLIKNFKMPIDEKELKILILEGIAPSVKEMLEYIKSKI